MTPNFAQKIVHSSALYYQNFIIIHESSRKLLKMKNSKKVFLTPSTTITLQLFRFLLISPLTCLRKKQLHAQNDKH